MMASQQPKIWTSFEFKGPNLYLCIHFWWKMRDSVFLLTHIQRYLYAISIPSALPDVTVPRQVHVQYHQLQGRSSSSCRCKSNSTSMHSQRVGFVYIWVAGRPILGDVTFMKGEEDRNILMSVSASIDWATIAHWGTIGEKGRVRTGLLINRHSRFWVVADWRCN